nr:unnamed protein product [Spirometra erinaceieuropaei]
MLIYPLMSYAKACLTYSAQLALSATQENSYTGGDLSSESAAEDLKGLTTVASPLLGSADKEHTVLHYFIKVLPSSELSRSLLLQPPDDIQDAVNRAERHLRLCPSVSRHSPSEDTHDRHAHPMVAGRDTIEEELRKIQGFLRETGYPERFIEKNIAERPIKPATPTAEKKPLFLKVPFQGDAASELLSRRLDQAVSRTFPAARVQIAFSTNPILRGEDLRGRRIQSGETMVSFDVTSLFTSIPRNMASDALRKRLEEAYDETQNTLEIGHLMRLFEFCQQTFFTFAGEAYEQIKGTPMGSTVSGLVAELVLQQLEKIAFIQHEDVDDTFVIVKKDMLQHFHSLLNAVFPDITLTREEQEQQLPFLDVLVIRNLNGEL